MPPNTSRRDFLQTTAAGAIVLSAPSFARARGGASPKEIRIGVIGCGGRGTGAAVDALTASDATRIVALGDAFSDRLESCAAELAKKGPRGAVAAEKRFTGLDAYQKVIASDVDLVILAAAPGFRPLHIAAAVAAGKHVFAEKPVAVDPAGVRTVLQAAESIDEQGLSFVCGTQRRHESCYLEAMRRVHDGAIGEIVSARCYWNQGSLWVKEKQPDWSDAEWQIRNWLYFTWLSGDHIVEQHVHNLDVVNWAIGSHPLRAVGMGGRQVRTEAKYGNVFDHFAIDYEYPGGVRALSMCRQIDGCHSAVEEIVQGTHGTLYTTSGSARIEPHAGAKAEAWEYTGENKNPYVVEHEHLISAIQSGRRINEARRIAESTLVAIMGRMSTYTGKEVSWEQALESKLDLMPRNLAFGPLAVPEIAVPGRTPLV